MNICSCGKCSPTNVLLKPKSENGIVVKTITVEIDMVEYILSVYKFIQRGQSLSFDDLKVLVKKA